MPRVSQMDLSEPKTFHPAVVSRRSEGVAWALSGVLAVGFVLIQGGLPAISWGMGILLALFLVGASAITLSNWMDRRTQIDLDLQGIGFTNGLRNLRLDWDRIREIRVLPGRWGARRVQVLTEESYFEFQTLGVLEYRGAVQGNTGFPDGDAILDVSLEKSGLVIMREMGSKRVVYTRE